MNLFSVVEGLKEENLSSAILRLLLLRSEDIRERFIELVSEHCKMGPVTIGDQFACATEHPTNDDSLQAGRLDLIIETANTVIGVENKLFAEFQTGQPEKYLQTLEEHASKLKALRGRRVEHVLVILAPESRKGMVEAKIKTTSQPMRYISLTWEVAFARLSKATELDPATATVLAEFRHFLLDEKLAFIPQFARIVPHLGRSFEPRGTAWQREVVGRLWRFFPDPGPRLNSATTWVGYYLCYGSKKHTGWYGFVPASEIKSAREDIQPAELVVATSFPVAFSSPAISSVDLNPNFLGKGVHVHAWRINFGAGWADPKIWQEALSPLSEAYESLSQEQSPVMA